MFDFKDIKEPFASQGQRAGFSYQPTLEGFISWLSGYTARYGQKPEENGLYIERLEFNQILYLLSAYMIDLKNNSATADGLNEKLDKIIYENDKPFFVTTNTEQDINALKNFTICPRTGVNPTNPSDLVRLAYLLMANCGVGANQNYQVFDTTQRNLNITYTNTTNKPILCILTLMDRDGSNPLKIFINNILAVKYDDFGISFERGNFSFIVPANQTYRVETNNILEYWSELR